MDRTLLWNAHLNHILNKVSALLGPLCNIVRCIPCKMRYVIYNTLVTPHLLYLVEVGGSVAKTELSNVQRAQNKCIKLIFNYPRLRQLKKYENIGIMTIRQLYVYNIYIREILNKTYT